MAFQDDRGGGGGGGFGGPRQKHDVSSMGLKCAECGTDITELPFVPSDPTRPVYCFECNRNRRRSFGPPRGGGGGGGRY